MVDMYSALDPATDLYDIVHPNAAGYAKMADVWFDGHRGRYLHARARHASIAGVYGTDRSVGLRLAETKMTWRFADLEIWRLGI